MACSINHTDGIGEVFEMLKALRDPSGSGHSLALQTLPSQVMSEIEFVGGVVHPMNSPFVLNMFFIFVNGSAYESAGMTSDIRQLSGLIIKN